MIFIVDRLIILNKLLSHKTQLSAKSNVKEYLI